MKWRRYATVAKAPNKGETGLDAEANAHAEEWLE